MADYFGTDTVVSELREDGLLIIRINRPDVANALNGVTSAAMENIMNHAETDASVRAIIVTGTGKVFCAGEDLSELSEGGECQTVTEHGFGGSPHASALSRSSAPATARRQAVAWKSPFPATW